MLGEVMRLMESFYVGEFIPGFSWINDKSRSHEKVEISKEFDEFPDVVVEEHLINMY